jgi:hypothetical protein
VLDEGGAALVVGRRVAVQAPDVASPPPLATAGGSPAPSLPAPRAAAPPPTRPTIFSASSRTSSLLLSASPVRPSPRLASPVYSSAASLAWMMMMRGGGGGGGEREREWVGLIGLVGLLPRTSRPAGTKICGRKVGPAHELSMRGPRGRGEGSGAPVLAWAGSMDHGRAVGRRFVCLAGREG